VQRELPVAAEGELTVCALKPTFGSVIGADASGSYARYG
jgi:hypothetical protein